MKGQDDHQNSMNHMNVLLQSLYSSCPLRKAIFSASERLEDDPLQLVFAKMYYDIENQRDTEATIYFKDSYLMTASRKEDPIDFYSWISRKLFETKKYRKLLQWKILTRKSFFESTTSTSEVLIEDEFKFLKIQSENFQSIQSFLNDFFGLKSEQVLVTVDGESQEETLQISKEVLNQPTIATFTIERGREEGFIIEEAISLNDKVYNLNSFIMISNDEKYSVCLKGKDSFWYKIQDDSYERISQENIINLATKYGYLLFYIDSEYNCDPSYPSPKPSQELIMDSLTKNTIHTISKTVQKNTNSPPLKPINGLPSKTKNMSPNQLDFVSSVSSGGSGGGSSSSSSASPSTPRPQSQLSLPLKKAASIAELAQLDAILVPADLSSVKMNLLKTDQSEPIEKEEEENNGGEEDKNDGIVKELGSSFDDFTLFPKDQNDDENDIELEYFKEVDRDQRPSRKYSNVWSQHYLKQTTDPQNSELGRDIFAGLLDFEIDFHEAQADSKPFGSQMDDIEDGDGDEDEDEMFIKASLAKIRKSRIDSGKSLSDGGKSRSYSVKSEDLSPGDQSKQLKKSSLSLKAQTARFMLTSGPSFHPQRSIIPLGLQAKAGDLVDGDDDHESNIKVYKKQKDIKRTGQYAKF